MSAPVGRAALRAKRRELRRAMALARQQGRARLRELQRARPGERNKQLRRLVALALLLLVAWLAQCDCGPVPAAVAEPAAPPPVEKPAQKSIPVRLPPIEGRLPPRQRADYTSEAPRAQRWVDDFRLQVTARSPRLAACFEGLDRPGALRWTSAVDPRSGLTSDHLIEPLGSTGELAKSQRECLVAALAQPPYRLAAGEGERSTPSRVVIVIEF